MDITKLMEPAERIFEFAKNEYVKLRLYPTTAQYQIEAAKTAGIDLVKLAELVDKNKMRDMNEKKAVAVVAQNQEFKSVLTPDFDGNVEYKLLVCLHGVDPDDHSFMMGDRAAKLDRAFWTNMLQKSPKLFGKIQAAVEKFQEEYAVILDEPVNESGEANGNS